MIDELVSEDLGFKLDTSENGVSIFDEPINFEELGDKSVNLLSIDNTNNIIAASNHKSLKFLTPELTVTTVDQDFKISQLYFHNEVLYILNDDKIQSITSQQIKSKSFDFFTIEKGSFIKIKPTKEGLLKLTHENELILNSSLIATGVTSFYDKEIYSNNPLKLGDKHIKIEDVDEYNIVDILPISSSFFVAYQNEEDMKVFILKPVNDDYIADEIDIVPQFGSIERKSTYYNVNIKNWYKDVEYSVVTSSGSTELGIIESSQGHENVITLEEDTSRANLPLDEETMDDCSPIGMSLGIDLTAKALEPCPGVDESVGKLPKIYCLLHTGNLVIWWLSHKAGLLNDELTLQKEIEIADEKVPDKANEKIDTNDPGEDGKVEDKAALEESQSIAQTKAPETVNPFGTSDASAFKSQGTANPFGSTNSSAFKGFGSSTLNASAAASGFGQTSFGSNFGSTGFATPKEKQQSNPSLVSGFGSFAKSSTSFGSFNGKQNVDQSKSIFGESKMGDQPETDSMFGGINKSAEKSKSIFGESKMGNATESIFGKSKKSTDESKSIFGESKIENTKESMFGGTNKTANVPNPILGDLKLDNKSKTDFNSEEPNLEINNAKLDDKSTQDKSPKEKPKVDQSFTAKFDSTLQMSKSPTKTTELQDKLGYNYFNSSSSQKTNIRSGKELSPFAQLNQTSSSAGIAKGSMNIIQGEETTNSIKETIMGKDSPSSEPTTTSKSLIPLAQAPTNFPLTKSSNGSTDVSKPVEFLLFDGFTTPLARSNTVIGQIQNILMNTEGNLSILNRNVEALSQYIDNKTINPPLIEFDLKKTNECLHEIEQTLSDLILKISKTQQDRIKLDKLYSQLYTYSKNQTKFKEIFKNRPLDLKYELLQTKLRNKLENVKQMEEGLITLLMPLKFKNSMNDKTISNIENLVFPINEQINEHKKTISSLKNEIDEVSAPSNSQLIKFSAKPTSSKLKLRQKLLSNKHF